MFLDDGVYELVKGQNTAAIGMKNFSPTYRTLGDYEVKNIYVDRDGIITGRYSNGAELQLYQTVLYDFRNKVGLFREGGNLFSQTIASGERQFGKANTLGLGAVNSNSLEMSNVDLAREFVDMITTQRGFSANGKVITTTDQMLSEVIMLKR